MIGREPFDLILCGKQAVDSDTHQVGPAVAEHLGLPAVTFVTSLELSGDGATAGREAEGVSEKISVKLPALLSCQKGLNEPRYPSLPGIMQAARKPKQVLTLGDLGIDPQPKVKRRALQAPPVRAAGRILSGEIPAQAQELVHLLKSEAKAI